MVGKKVLRLVCVNLVHIGISGTWLGRRFSDLCVLTWCTLDMVGKKVLRFVCTFHLVPVGKEDGLVQFLSWHGLRGR